MLANLFEFRNNPSLPPSARMPDFLQRRMDEFYVDRMQGLWGGKHIMHGVQPSNSAIQLMSNDYLSLVNHPQILQAQIAALQNASNEVVMSGVFMHGENPVSAFEQRMATFCGYQAGILSQSGYAANVGLIQALAEKNVPVYIDMHAHASLWEGVMSAGATPHAFRHNDPEHLDRQMRQYGQGVLCVDSVYSTLGSIAPLEDLVDVAEKYDSLIIVDESHSLGTHGVHGEGLVRQLGLHERVHFVTASLAKAFAARAGIVLCSERFKEYFRCTARPAIFSSSLLNHEVAALDKTLDIIQADDWRRDKLFHNARFLRQQLSDLGYNVRCSQSQIIPIEAGVEQDTLVLREKMEEQGVFGAVFCAPATPKKRSLVRLSVNAALTVPQMLEIVRVMGVIRDDVGMWRWPSTVKGGAQAPARAVLANW
ncbi:MAG: quorum-sensing autoinducer CAI-1 synthase [Alcanivoracaceae bacterium]|nr:quorum-sensing autoinducer CAI-1 synthase [Alcanivoracaceae bacterium]